MIHDSTEISTGCSLKNWSTHTSIRSVYCTSPDGLIRSGEDCMLSEIKTIFNPEGSSLEELIRKRPDLGLSNDNDSFP
ncbi:hypothetical protein NPIL_667681 [Nephila pilipes]|uniref:Uncharacterized protein n=1 Tax=Nephila pilipes TaxID=299642 RepID=A0A8X6Q794_NEPPI|nr:hypothetical protein NPIL_667681 [Nephila pilipes]